MNSLFRRLYVILRPIFCQLFLRYICHSSLRVCRRRVFVQCRLCSFCPRSLILLLTYVNEHRFNLFGRYHPLLTFARWTSRCCHLLSLLKQVCRLFSHSIFHDSFAIYINWWILPHGFSGCTSLSVQQSGIISHGKSTFDEFLINSFG